MKKIRQPYQKKLKCTTVRKISLLVFHGFVQLKVTIVSSSSKGEILTLCLIRVMVSPFQMACEILFQAFGAVYKKLFSYVLILAFVHVGSPYS